MKYIIKIILSVFIFSFSYSCVFSAEGFSGLYFIKKNNADIISGIMRDTLKEKGYKVLGSSNMYVIPENDDPMVPKYYVILFKQNKNDCYYYNLTNENYMLNDLLLAELDKRKIKYKKKNNKDLEELFEEAAIAFKGKAEIFNVDYKYDFSEEAQKKFDKLYDDKASINNDKLNPLHRFDKSDEKDFSSIEMNGAPQISQIQVQEQPRTKTLNGRVLTVPSGTVINAKLQSDISTASLSTDDSITASLLTDFEYNNVLIAPAGSILYGKAINAKKAGYAYGNSSVDISFHEIMTPEGKTFAINTETIHLQTDSKRAGKITRDIAVGSAIGVVGGLVGALLGVDMKNSILWGLGAGAASGTMHAVLQRGENIEIQSEQNLHIKLLEPLTVSD